MLRVSYWCLVWCSLHPNGLGVCGWFELFLVEGSSVDCVFWGLFISVIWDVGGYGNAVVYLVRCLIGGSCVFSLL